MKIPPVSCLLGLSVFQPHCPLRPPLSPFLPKPPTASRMPGPCASGMTAGSRSGRTRRHRRCGSASSKRPDNWTHGLRSRSRQDPARNSGLPLAADPVAVDFGNFTLAEAGGQRVVPGHLQPSGEKGGTILALELDCPALEGAHFNTDPRRNAASVHLAYPTAEDAPITAFYNEALPWRIRCTPTTWPVGFRAAICHGGFIDGNTAFSTPFDRPGGCKAPVFRLPAGP